MSHPVLIIAPGEYTPELVDQALRGGYVPIRGNEHSLTHILPQEITLPDIPGGGLGVLLFRALCSAVTNRSDALTQGFIFQSFAQFLQEYQNTNPDNTILP